MMANKLTLKHVAEEMQGIDIAILSTNASDGGIACRPMSNNRDVEYDGTSFFFTCEQASCVTDIERNPKVALGYSSSGIIGGSVYIAVEGSATLVREKPAFEKHWTSDLNAWFEEGIDNMGEKPGAGTGPLKLEISMPWIRHHSEAHQKLRVDFNLTIGLPDQRTSIH